MEFRKGSIESKQETLKRLIHENVANPDIRDQISIAIEEYALHKAENASRQTQGLLSASNKRSRNEDGNEQQLKANNSNLDGSFGGLERNLSIQESNSTKVDKRGEEKLDERILVKSVQGLEKIALFRRIHEDGTRKQGNLVNPDRVFMFSVNQVMDCLLNHCDGQDLTFVEKYGTKWGHARFNIQCQKKCNNQ